MGLEFQDISHAYDHEQVLKGIDLTARRGEVMCLLGPSGCGKTTLLRLAAGLMPVQTGRIALDGISLATAKMSMPPEKRPVGLVFQEGALFPHLTVGANIAFGLKGTDAEKRTRVAELLPKIGLAGFEDRFPHTLSGGQQQRVALARALAPAPKVLLLDEPFANIDSQLRRDLREETRRTLKASDTAVVLVTHDPDEALEMGDCIAVMDHGRVVQLGAPQELYDNPATSGVAKMFGRGQSLAAEISDGHVETAFGRWPVACLTAKQDSAGPIELVVRQDAFELTEQPGGQAVVDIRSAGHEQLVFVEGDGGQVLRVQLSRDQQVAVGTTVSLQPRNESIFSFPAT